MSSTEDWAAPAASPVPARRPAAPRGSSPRQKTPPPGRASAAPAAVANSTTGDSNSAAPEESGQRAAPPRTTEEGPSNGSAAAAVRKPRSSSPRGALRRSTTETPADTSVPASPRSSEPLATSTTQRSVAVEDAETEDLIPRDVTAVPPCETLEDYDHEYGTVWRLEVALASAWGWTFAAIVVFAAGLYRPRVYSGSDATFSAAVDLGITTVCMLGKCTTFDYSGADFVVGTCRAKGSDFLWRIIFLQVLLGLSAIGALISWIGATFAALRPVMPTRITVAAFGAWVSFVFGAAGMVLAYFTFSSFIFCSGFCVAVATTAPCGEGVGDSFYMLCGAIGAMLVSAVIFTRLRWAVYKSQQQRCEEREAAEEERLAAAYRRKREREEARRRELEARRLEQQRKRQRRVQITEPIKVTNPSETSRGGAEASTAYVAPVEEEENEELPSPIKEPAAAAEAEPVNYSQRSGVLTPERAATDVGVSVRTDATAQEWTFEPGAGMYYSDSGAVWWDPVHRQYYDSAARLWSRQDPRALTAAEREDRESLVSSRNSLLNQSRNVSVVSPVRRSVQSPDYGVVMAQSVRQGLDVSVLRRSSHAESSSIAAAPTNSSTANPLPPTAAEATPQRPRVTVKRRAASPSSAQRPPNAVERSSSSFRRFDPEIGEWVEGNA